MMMHLVNKSNNAKIETKAEKKYNLFSHKGQFHFSFEKQMFSFLSGKNRHIDFKL